MVELIIKESKRIEEQLKKEAKEVRIRTTAAVLVFVVLVLVGGLIYNRIEYYPGTLQHWNYLDGVYFATMTITTIGYGDLTPTTSSGKIFTMFFAFLGIAVAFYVFFIVGQFLMHYKIVLLRKGKRRFIRKRAKK